MSSKWWHFSENKSSLVFLILIFFPNTILHASSFLTKSNHFLKYWKIQCFWKMKTEKKQQKINKARAAFARLQRKLRTINERARSDRWNPKSKQTKNQKSWRKKKDLLQVWNWRMVWMVKIMLMVSEIPRD